MLDALAALPEDPIWGLTSAFRADPRAHKIVETPDGREYIPDTNSNNILHLEGIHPPPEASERKKGYMLRPVGEIEIPSCVLKDFN